MSSDDGDWRLNGQDAYLTGVPLYWRPYRALSAVWEHEHCEFCWSKFMDPDYSEGHRAAIASNSGLLTAGYTTYEGEQTSGSSWICERCFADFRERFGWVVTRADEPAPKEEQ